MPFWRVFALSAVTCLVVACNAHDSTIFSEGRVLYVSAQASPDGDGTRTSPFNSLEAIENASQPGDTLVVLAVAIDVPPLDGGIALKRGQRLIGDGPDVLKISEGRSVAGGRDLPALPRIRNTTAARHHGDAVRLAEQGEVRNLVVTEAVRGAVYGLNTPDVLVQGNDISGYNTSCTIGYVVQPFIVPTILPHVGAPLLLPAGWAGIMVDADSGAGSMTLVDNYVHDSACGNGIDVRISGSANYEAEISGNFVTELKFGPLHQLEELHLVHAISIQATDTGVLQARSVANTQTYIGAPNADCEGLFMNLAGNSTGIWTIDSNTFAHGIGGSSCNGMEFIISNGSPHGEMYLSNSSFEDNQGDMLEQGNLGSGSTMVLELDNVTVYGTHQRGGQPEEGFIPFNTGECLIAGSSGAGNSTILKVRNSRFSGCNNGLTVLSGTNPITGVVAGLVSTDPQGNPLGPDKLVDVEVLNSRIVENDFNNVFVGVLTRLERLRLKVENTDLSHAGENSIRLVSEFFGLPLGQVDDLQIDFGSEHLPKGSQGRNCIFGSGQFDVVGSGLSASLRNNWWGNPGAPDASRISPSGGSQLDIAQPLTIRPDACHELQ